MLLVHGLDLPRNETTLVSSIRQSRGRLLDLLNLIRSDLRKVKVW
jgi:hypothetical protein